jgi:hypothetical protein
LRELYIKDGMPTVDEARKRLIEEIALAKRQGIPALKIIHGYGSTGAGGALKTALRKSLSLRMKEGKIRAYVGGDKWSIFEEKAREILDRHPPLRRDPDLDRSNDGITIVLL